MKLTATQLFAAPPEAVFDRIADFQAFEDRARDRGADVMPMSTEDGLGWQVMFHWHGAHREVDLFVETFERPRGYTARGTTSGVRGLIVAEVTPLSPERTRASLTFDLAPTSFTGRLLMQTLRLGRPALEARLERFLANLARDLERGR